MTLRALWCLLPILSAACGTPAKWRESETPPMPIGKVYDGIEYIATHAGYAPAGGECDRGLGTWTSRWRERQLGLGRPGRFRLVTEILVDEGAPDRGWIVRYKVEQQKVKDLKKSMNPEESDWSRDGQDAERESQFADALQRRLAPAATVERKSDPAGASAPEGSRSKGR